mgnify:CR=1 FL=1
MDRSGEVHQRRLVGIDIGGTKCSVSMGCRSGEEMQILDRIGFSTLSGQPHAVIGQILDEFDLVGLTHLLKEPKGFAAR